jgi:hypothetical protein
MSALPLPRPTATRHSFYERLGVAVDADVATLRTAWEGRQAALPATLDPIERAVCLAELREALDVLSDPTRRAAYDERLRERERETRVLRPHGQALSDPVAQAADRERVRALLGLPASVAGAHDAAANEATAALEPTAPVPLHAPTSARSSLWRRRPWLVGLGSGLGAAVLVLALAPVTQSSGTRELSDDAARAAADAATVPGPVAGPARSHTLDGEPLPLRLSGELPAAR